MMHILVIAVLALGAGAMLVGLVGRWVDHDLHCRACSYNLTGIASPHCPECGAALQPSGVRRGLRRRRRGVLLMGAAPWCLAAALWSGRFYVLHSHINWYAWMPNVWIKSAALQGNSDAVNEFMTRWYNNAFPRAWKDAFVEEALIEHARVPAASDWNDWCTMLSRLEQARLLTPWQRERFFSQLVLFELTARPAVRIGDPIVFRIDAKDRSAPLMRYAYEFCVESQTLGGAPLDGQTRFWSGVCRADSAISGPNTSFEGAMRACDPPGLPPGRYRLEVALVYSIDIHERSLSRARIVESFDRPAAKPQRPARAADWRSSHFPSELLELGYRDPPDEPATAGPASAPADSPIAPPSDPASGDAYDRPRWVKLVTDIDNLPSTAPDPLRLHADPVEGEVYASVLYGCQFVALRLRNDRVAVQGRIPWLYWPGDCPLPRGAFELLVRTDEGDFPAGELVWSQSHYALARFESVPPVETPSVHLVARGSREVAAKTVDLTDAWDGEIDLGWLPVTEDAAAVAVEAPAVSTSAMIQQALDLLSTWTTSGAAPPQASGTTGRKHQKRREAWE